jgi:hypothetical protein
MKNKYFLFGILLATFSACKKDLPEGLPQWLTDYIYDCKRGNRDCCKEVTCNALIISSAKGINGKTVYIFSRFCNNPLTTRRIYFSSQGDTICDAVVMSPKEEISYPSGCDSTIQKSLSQEQRLWPDYRIKSGPNCSD